MHENLAECAAPIEPCETDALKRLRDAAILAAVDIDQALAWQHIEACNDCLAGLGQGQGLARVVRVGVQPVAFAVVRPGPLPHLAALYVHPSHQGRGLGSALLAGLEQELRARGAVRLATAATDHARGFYLRHGFADGFVSHECAAGLEAGVRLRFHHLRKALVDHLRSHPPELRWPIPRRSPN